MTDLDGLDSYLSSDDSPDDCMMLSDLDGFLHGVACSPVSISVDEWMPVALGGSPDDLPDWVLQSIYLIYDSIMQGLTFDPPEVEPIFWQAQEGHVIAMDWCEGFMQAVSPRPKQWLRLTESGTCGQLISPMMVHLLDDNGNSVIGIPQEELDQALNQAAEKIPESVVAIYRFW
jgi:yecA family protein